MRLRPLARLDACQFSAATRSAHSGTANLYLGNEVEAGDGNLLVADGQ